MTSLMGERLMLQMDVRRSGRRWKNQLKTHSAQVVRSPGAAGNGGEIDDDAVVPAFVGVVRRESSISEFSLARTCDITSWDMLVLLRRGTNLLENEPDGVDIEISSATLTEFGLHFRLLR